MEEEVKLRSGSAEAEKSGSAKRMSKRGVRRAMVRRGERSDLCGFEGAKSEGESEARSRKRMPERT